jgi:hypothetical protein
MEVEAPPVHNDAMLTVVFSGGYLAWYELEELLTVFKFFQRNILQAKPRLPDWPKMTAELNKMNGFNKCDYCGEDIFQCGDTEEERSEPHSEPHEFEPRQGDYATLPAFEQFKLLLHFHQMCISNLQEFFPEDLSAAYADGSDYDFYAPALAQLAEYNPVLKTLMCNIVSLSLARGDLSSSPFWYREAFEGTDLNPATGSSHRDCFAYSFQDLLDQTKAQEGEEEMEGMFEGHVVTVSQLLRLDESILKYACPEYCPENCPTAALFGPLMSSIDVFGKYHAPNNTPPANSANSANSANNPSWL